MLVIDDDGILVGRYFTSSSYVSWLESFAVDDYIGYDVGSYSKLINELWETPFESYLGNDADRAEDGMDLRFMYKSMLAEEIGIDEYVMPDISDLLGECRVLEVLISMSMYMYDMMTGTREYNTVARWFWEMMENSGLVYFEDNLFVYETVRNILDDILKRRYNVDTNGFFGVYGWQEIELWYQMQDFIKGIFK